MFLNDLINKPTETEEGDYKKDGLLYCHYCNTPKECEINLLGNKMIVACLCKHRSDDLKKQEAEEKQKAHEKYIQRLRDEAFPSKIMHDWTFENAEDSELIRIAKNYAINFDTMLEQNKGLLFLGNVGNGKTYVSACIVNYLIDKGIPCLMTSVPRLANTLLGMYEGKQDYLDGLNFYKLLVIDDLGVERSTETMNENVYSIFDARYLSGLPLIVTTNLTSEEIKHTDKVEKARIYDRLMERCHPVETKDKSRRKASLKKDYQAIQNILEGKA